MTERLNFHNQIQHLHSQYVGTGNVDTSQWEWGTNIQRDTLSSHIGHHSRLLYMATCENESLARMKTRFLNQMIQPCGPPPPPKKKGDF